MFKTLKKISKVGTFSSTSSSSCSSGTINSSNGDESANNINNNEPTKLSDRLSSYQFKKAKFNVIAMHNYIPVNEDTDLALCKGEIYEILDSSGVWWMARDRRGQIGLVPYNYTQTIANETTLCSLVCGDNNSGLIQSGRRAKRRDYGEDLIKQILDNNDDEDGDGDGTNYDCEEQVQERLMQCMSFSQDEYYETESEPESAEFQSASPHSVRSPMLPPPLPAHQHRHLDGLISKASSTAPDSTVMMDLNVLSLWQHAWFFAIDRPTSEQLLKQQCHRDGCFLVRPSTTENDCFTLSVLIKKKKQMVCCQVKHYLIQKCQTTQNAMYYIRPQEKFPSIQILIEHYQGNRGHLLTQLSQVPCRANFIWQKHSSLRPWQPTPKPKQTGEQSIAPCMEGLMMDKSCSGSNMQQQQSMVAKRLVNLTKDKYWEIKVSELQLLEELGSGQFGVVRHGKWKSKFDVAVKLMKEGTMSEQDFIDEAKVMTKLQHPNLVKLYGICIEHRPICIVAEFMKHGSLLCFLRKNESKILDSSQKIRFLLNMCIQVASAMAYLESHNYIHRDLAARNCLVGNSNVVKVADFGLTRYVIDDEYTSSGGTKFPIRWAPPEVLWFTRFSSKSDVWAYGILVWEVFSLGKLPYGKLTNAEVVEKIRQGHRLDKPKQCPPEIFQLMKSCWQEVAEKRPSFQKIERCLITLKECDMDQSQSNGNITAISTSPTKQQRQF